MRKFPVLAGLLVLLRLSAAPTFPPASSDLHPDPAALFGVLPDGVRTVVLPNREPHDRASLRLLVLSGSLEEGENQRGLAHFLEHMAFNGSSHYPPGTLVEYFQRLGMSFGGDTNAYTSFDRTVYMIELPDTRPGTLAEGLRVLADMAGGLLLRPDMIAKERPIILSEKRTRDSADYRQFAASLDFLLGDSLFSKRLPIGLQPVIEQAGRDRFVDYYDAWYRPERMAVIVVGDIDPAAASRGIAAAFEPVRDRAAARSDPDLGRATAALGLRAAYHREPDAAATTVSIDVIAPYAYQTDTSELRLRHLPRDLAVAMLNRRLSILAKKEGAPFISATASIQENFNFVHDAGVEFACAPDQWAATLGMGERQLRTALEFGFTQAELQEAVAGFKNELIQAVAAAPTRRSDGLADELVESLVARQVFTSPAQDLALYRPALERVTPDDCLRAFRAAFALPGRFVMVSGNAVIPGDAAAAIIRTYENARAVPAEAPGGRTDTSFAYTAFGPPGKTEQRRHVDDLDLTLARFSNGVRADIKKTPFEANQIRIRVRVGGGRLSEDPGRPGLGLFADLAFLAGGLGRHSADDLQRILAGKTVGLDFAIRDDAFEFSASTNREDLLLQLQLIAAYLTDPGYRPEALRVARKDLDELYTEMDHSIAGPLQAEVPRLLAGGDPRFGLPGRAEALSVDLGQEKAWLDRSLGRGAIEIGLVGDLDIDETLSAVSRTLGALPAREAKPSYQSERGVHFPPTSFSRDFTVPTEIPKAEVAVYWPTADARDVRRARRLTLLADVLSDRLRIKIREQLGGAYSPQALSEPSDTFTNYGVMAARCVVAPDRTAEILRSILAVAADMQANGITGDELDRAKKPVLTALRESVRTNPYWIRSVVGICQEFPERLDWARSRQADIEAITRDDIDALAKQYLASDLAFKAIVRPAPHPL